MKNFSLPHGIFRIVKRHAKGEEPYEVIEFENDYVDVGGQLLLDLLIGAGGTAFDNTNAYIGIGDSSTPTTSSMTDLQAATNKHYAPMDATYPSRSGQVMTWFATIATGDANFTWEEVALFNGNTPPTDIMLARGVESMGTKVSGEWEMSYTITVP